MSVVVLPNVPESGQHLLRWSNQLTALDRRRLANDLGELDWSLIERLSHLSRLPTPEIASAEPAKSIVTLRDQAAPGGLSERARRCGEELLGSGRVGAILVAGGQAARLGIAQPKGTLPFGPVTRRSLFQWHCEQLAERSRRAGVAIPYLIMTSETTHVATVSFFGEHEFFGLPEHDVYFFQQGSLPTLDVATGRPFLTDKHRIARSPDGHGGLLSALTRHRLWEMLAERGIEHLYYHQVDNPAAIVCDPLFLGLHWLQQADVSTKVVEKCAATERMGVVAQVAGKTQIVEYTELSHTAAAAQTPACGGESARLQFWAGNTAIHVFRRAFLQQLTQSGVELPYHVVRRPVPYLDEQGECVIPQAANAFKFEQFLFDVLPYTERTLIMETARSREFLPIKEATGDNSPASSGHGLMQLWRGWLRAAGVTIDSKVRVEISPAFALEEADLYLRSLPPKVANDCVFE